MKGYLFFIFFSIVFISCKHKSVNCGKACDDNEELIFQTGFNNASISNIEGSWYDIHGIDRQYTELNNWDALDENHAIGDFKINCGDGNDSQRWAKIMQDPADATNNVLAFRIIEPHQKEPGKMKGRVQVDLNGNNCIYEFYETVRLYLHPDMNYLKEWDEKFSWLSLFEFWNNANWTKEKHPSRVTVNLRKNDTGKVDALYFNAKSDNYKGLGRWETNWEQTATSFPVQIGSWMDIEVYIKDGDENSGRFYMAVTPQGGEKQVVFDITNFTHHPKEKCPDGFSEIHALKFYTSEELINYMKSGNKHLEIYWDDWKIYRNFRPKF